MLRAELRRDRPGARGRAAPPRERLARARGRPRARAPARARRGRARHAPATSSGRRARHGSSRARAPRVEHWLSRFTDAQIAAAPAARAGRRRRRSSRTGAGDLAEHWLRRVAAAATPPAEVARRRRGPARGARPRRARARWPTDAPRVAALLAPDSPCQALCGLLAGVAEHLRGDARARRAAGSRTARAAPPCPPRRSHALCLVAARAAWRSTTHDWEEAARLSTRARAQVARYGLARYPTSALVLAVSALVRAQRGPRRRGATPTPRDAPRCSSG